MLLKNKEKILKSLMKGTKHVLKKKKEESPGRWETQASWV